MLEEKSYIVLAVGTDIGKTFLVENLCKKNSKYNAIKPIITGFINDNNSDSAKILNARSRFTPPCIFPDVSG